jgi:hypothetical protein
MKVHSLTWTPYVRICTVRKEHDSISLECPLAKVSKQVGPQLESARQRRNISWWGLGFRCLVVDFVDAHHQTYLQRSRGWEYLGQCQKCLIKLYNIFFQSICCFSFQLDGSLHRRRVAKLASGSFATSSAGQSCVRGMHEQQTLTADQSQHAAQ